MRVECQPGREGAIRWASLRCIRRCPVDSDGKGRRVAGRRRSAAAHRGEDGADRRLVGSTVAVAKVPVRHDPGKIILDLAVAVALGGDCLADFALLWAHPEVFARSPPIQRSPG